MNAGTAAGCICCGLASLSAILLAALSIKLARTRTPLTYWPTPSTAPLPTLSSQVSLLHTLGQMAVLAARVACPQATSASTQLTFCSTHAQVLFPDTRNLKHQGNIQQEKHQAYYPAAFPCGVLCSSHDFHFTFSSSGPGWRGLYIECRAHC